MAWCEASTVGYVLGLAKNDRRKGKLADALAQAKQIYQGTGKAARLFEDFHYQARKSWSRSRRVIGKAEHLSKGANPRFVVTTLTAEQAEAQTTSTAPAVRWRTASRNSSLKWSNSHVQPS